MLQHTLGNGKTGREAHLSEGLTQDRYAAPHTLKSIGFSLSQYVSN